jgi:beta-lactamase superfamily II metal-dependent hydrolase
VGTGLAIVVRGNQFTLIYDGGSNDDLARGDDNRFLSFLRSQHSDLQTIDHVILSHPHRDHVELLPDLIANYQMRHFWDSGAVNDICGYRSFIHAISLKAQAVYHSARFNFGNHPVNFAAKTCYGQDLAAATISLPHGSKINHDPIVLGPGVSMKFLHADGSKHGGFNENSIVMRLDFGQNRILFMGDAEGGGRADPDTPPIGHSIESILLDCCVSELRASVLIIGHHGSKTSSRAAFLNAVGAKQFVVSSGPMKYGSVVLPDASIVQALEKRGKLFRTDLNDQTCGQNPAKIGPDNDGKAGGCDNVRIILSNTPPAVTYLRVSD